MNSIEGVTIPDSPICQASLDYAKRVSEPYLFNHLMRTYAFGVLAGKQAGASIDLELLFVGALLHDLGLTAEVPVQDRFEVEGADAAKAFLAEQGMDERRIDVVWDAIALHTTMSVPQRKRPEIALVQTGAGIDVGVIPLAAVSADKLEEVLEAWPRLGMKKAIIDTLGGLLARGRGAANSHVVRDVGERTVDGFPNVNFCDVILNSAFAE